MWGKGEEVWLIPQKISIVGKVKPDSYNGGYFID